MSISLNQRVCGELCSQTVLLIDDNLYNLLPLIGMLEERFNIRSACFDNGKDAVTCF